MAATVCSLYACLSRIGADCSCVGLGALLSPLVATEFAKSPKFWSFHYIISAGLYVVNTAVLWYVFRGKRQEGQYDDRMRIRLVADVH